jgi:uncharacterized protein (TIGR02246 family)
MASDEAEIRDLINRWAQAVRDQDLEGILDRHSSDMLMFDVPPPVALRGIDAYRETWKPFFEAFRGGGVFEIDRLDVTAGDRVAFATALLRCETGAGADIVPRLRLTVGLRKEEDRWTIAHEHHSYPAES